MSAMAAWLLLTATSAGAQLSETPAITLIGGPAALWPQIVAEYARRYPSHAAVWRIGPSDARPADLIFAYYPTPDQVGAAPGATAARRLGVPAAFVAAAWKQPIDEEASARAAAYLDEGGVENGVRLLAYLYSLVRPGALAVDLPLPAPQAGIYHPDAPSVFLDYDSYRGWWHGTGRAAFTSGDPIAVAVPFFGSWLRGRDLAAVDAIVRRLEARGRMPVAVFGYPVENVSPLLHLNGAFQPQIAIALNATLTSAKDAEIYDSWGVPILNGLVTRESASQWRANPQGLPANRLTAHLSFPERAGLIAPTLVATTEVGADGIRRTEPFMAGMDVLLDRADRMLALRSRPNGAKRVALIYYDNPAGRGNIGASYLQVFPSLHNILEALVAEGYDIPQPLPDEMTLRRLLEANGRNVELWAGGELQRMSAASEADGAVVRWPIAAYRRYYDDLPDDFRASVEATWGAPERSRLMTADCPEGRCLILPVQRRGRILLAPQPLRTTFEQASDPGHEKVTPPPHQYIAFYLWLRHEWQADALVHLGRHGTLEWLPGKQTALAPEDAVQVLLGGVPNFNIYVMDGGGEAIQAKRRGLATLVSHLTPMIWRTGGRSDLETLHQSFHMLMDRAGELSAELAAEYERVTRAEVVRLKLDRQLNLDPHADMAAMAPALHRFLHDIENAPIPAGLPVFGQSPREDQLREAVGAYLFAAFPRDMHDAVESLVPAWADAYLAETPIDAGSLPAPVAAVLMQVEGTLPDWIRLLRESGHAEIAGLLAALRGAHLSSHLLGDPLRKPEALPAGANLHAVDSARIPTQAAWRVGQRMADEFLERYHASHGTPPRRVSLVLWYGETERQQGAMESMALALLGVRPVWNAQGLVEDLQLIERDELGRDRVDVVFTVSGNYRDGFPDKLQLLDRAVRLAARASDGVVAARDREMAAALELQGLEPDEAARQAEVRIFSAKPGAYGVGVQYLVEKSGDGDSPEQIAALYAANMGFGYTADRWGTASGPALAANLRTIDAVQFSRSSNLYASLDNDDTYQYVGGLRTAIAQAAARPPEVFVHDLRHAGAEKMVALREWLAVELHSRQFNPAWLREMQKSGYAGARQMSKELEHLYGFQKTAPDHLDNQTWQTVMDVFVKDTYGLGLTRFFEEQNPHARQTVLARLLEVDRQGIQRFSAEDRRMLLADYAASLARDGVACSAQICGNAALRRHVSQELRRQGHAAHAAAADNAFRRALTRPAQPRRAIVRRTATPPPENVAEWRLISTSIAPSTPWPLRFEVAIVPWWVWLALGCGHVSSAAIARARRRSSGAAITISMNLQERKERDGQHRH